MDPKHEAKTQLRLMGLRYLDSKAQVEDAKADLQEAVVKAVRQHGLSLREVERETGNVISNVTVLNWVRTPTSIFRRLRNANQSPTE